MDTSVCTLNTCLIQCIKYKYYEPSCFQQNVFLYVDQCILDSPQNFHSINCPLENNTNSYKLYKTYIIVINIKINKSFEKCYLKNVLLRNCISIYTKDIAAKCYRYNFNYF